MVTHTTLGHVTRWPFSRKPVKLQDHGHGQWVAWCACLLPS